MKRRLPALLLILCLALAGCGQPPAGIPPTSPGIPTATPRPTQTPTPTITPTPTPTPVIFSRLGTPLPEARQAITATNAGRLVMLGRWGKGIPAAAAVSPDGSLLAVAASSGLHLYDGASFLPRLSIELESPLTSIAIAPDSSLIAAGDILGTVRLWNAAGEPQGTFSANKQAVLSLAFSPDSARLAAGSWNRGIYLWQVAAGRLTAILRGHRRAPSRMAFSADGETLYTWSNREPVQRWPIPGGSPKEEWYIGQTNDGRTGSGAAFSADGAVFAAAQDWRVRVFNTADGTSRTQLQPVSAPIAAVALSPDGSLAATSDQQSVKIWQTADGSLLHETPALPASILLFGADGQSVLRQGSDSGLEVWRFTGAEGFEPALRPEYLPAHPSGSAFQRESGALVLRLLNGNLRTVLPEPVYSAMDSAPPGLSFDEVAVSLDGSLAAGGTANARVWVWQVDSGEMVYSLRGFGLNAGKLVFSPDGSLLATGSGDRRLRVFRMEDGSPVHTCQHAGPISRLAFSADGRLLATGVENRIQLWRVSDWTLLANYSGSHFAFAPQEDLLAVAETRSREQVITIHRVSKQTEVAVFSAGGSAMAFSPDGSLLALAGQELTLWDVSRGERLTALPLSRPFGEVAFSPQGDLLILTDWDGVVTGWGVP